MQRKPLGLLIAIGLLLEANPALAAKTDKQEIEALKQQLQALQAEVKALKELAMRPVPQPVVVAAPAPAPAVVASAPEEGGMDQRVTKMELQVEQLNKAAEEGPIAGLSVTGYVDLGYFYNSNARTNSFSFGRANSSAYAYDNSTTGDVYLDIKKTFGSGNTAPSAEIVIAPNRGYGAGSTGGNNIIHTAQVTLPQSPTFAYIFGQIGSWQGYDVYQSNQTNSITHNLLYDYAIPSYFTGAGATYTNGNAAWKFMVGNPQNKTFDSTVRSPSFTYRLDYTLDSKTNIGSSGYIGQQTNNVNAADVAAGRNGFRSLAYYNELDLTYTLFETTLNAELDYGRQKEAAWNGGDAVWWGLSLQGNYKFNDSYAGTLRADYLDNSRNGGGTPNLAFGANGSDNVNGFGIDPICYAAAQANDVTDQGYGCKGAKRSSLVAAFLYYPTKQTTLKAEYRYDRANIPVFAKKDGSLVKDNNLLSFQAVYGF